MRWTVAAFLAVAAVSGCNATGLENSANQVTVKLETNIPGGKLLKTIPAGAVSVSLVRSPIGDTFEIEIWNSPPPWAGGPEGQPVLSYTLSGNATMTEPLSIPNGATQIAVGDVGPGPWQSGKLVFDLSSRL